MPAQYGVWFQDEERVFLLLNVGSEQNEREPIGGNETRFFDLTMKDD